tara:strand:- start:1673 stop:2113 length:441 start_codon:yes stop_codon:yes gene_type:complete
MIKATVIIEYSRWKNKIKNPNNYIKNQIKKLSKLHLFKNKKQEFTILLTNNKKMKELNKKFRKKNKTTDVLSFPLNNNDKFYIGDIAISYEIINKRSFQTNFKLEFDKMWIHGYLHLNGYDHKKLKDFNKMNNKEKIILNSLNKKN